jgi:pyruvate,water dikinase
MTSPAWAPVLPLAGALVTDHGGVLSHAAVIAREFGIPAVVATGRATHLIPDGATIEVDGIHGLVRVMT